MEIPEPSARVRAFLSTRAGRTALSLVIEYFHGTLEGASNIPPRGGALVVGNHALLALDTVVLAALVFRDLGRTPRFLADRMLLEIPGVRQIATALGALPGEPRAATTLLRRGGLVVVYPGGVDDSLKLHSERYRLKWSERAGFAKVALAAQVPIVPVVGLGIDDTYSVIAREPWIGRRVFGSPRYDLPIALGAFGTPVPRRVPLRYIALPRIETRGGDPGSSRDVARVRDETMAALESHLRTARGGVA